MGPMATSTTASVQMEMTTHEPFNPLQSHHDHMYVGASKQKLKENAAREKSRSRSSRQIASSPEGAKNLKRRTSRLSAFGLFNRAKTPGLEEKPKLETQAEETEAREENCRQDSVTSHTNGHIHLSNVGTEIEPQTEPLRHRASRRALKTKESFTKSKSSTWPTIWEPPPLFQAYPQAVKFATLRSPTLAADTIIRLNRERQSICEKQAALIDQSKGSMRQKEKRPKKSLAPDPVSSNDWIDKVYLLATEGYLLQYAGHGKYDRAPEKILPLNSQSAAFASDMIPGKPFVLQVSQKCDESGAVNSSLSKDMLKKAGLKVEAKRSASSFLLVLTSPEDMNGWLMALRKAIEALGGKQIRTDVYGTDGIGPENSEEPAQEIQRIPSQRYLVKRQPHRFSQLSPEAVPLGPSEETGQAVGIPKTTDGNRSTMATPALTISPYTSDATASIDQVHLDRLRESPRQSYISTSEKTTSTSRNTSMDRSPLMQPFVDALETRANLSGKASDPDVMHSAWTLGEGIAVNERRLDQTSPTPPSPRRSSSTPTTLRAVSPPAPNFSVPTFSKRFSGISNLSNTSARTSPPVAQADPPPFCKHPATNPERGRERVSFVGEMHDRSSSRSRASKRMSIATQHSSRLSTPPKSSDSKDPPSSSEGERRYSRRHSSLTYAQGMSPLPLSNQSPSPHPPPTTALPPLPTNTNFGRTSLLSPPTGSLPPLPIKAHSEGSASLPLSGLSYLSKAQATNPIQTSSHAEQSTEVKLRRPMSMQIRAKATIPLDWQVR